MNKEKMGFFLASLRNEKNLTQQDEADIFSITPQAISKWESGQSVPDVETLEKLSSFYSVSINEILNGERASINETEVTETSGFNKMLMSRLTPFILSCSLFLATLLTYAFPYAQASNGSFIINVNMYSILGGGATAIINIFAYLAFFTMLAIFGLGFGVFFSKKAVLKFRSIQAILMWALLGFNVIIFALFIARSVTPHIGYFLTLLVVIAYIVLFLILPECKKDYLEKTIAE